MGQKFTSARMTACNTALPPFHTMKRSPQDRRGRQAASAAVFSHYNVTILNLPHLKQQYPKGLACCDGSALQMGICATKKPFCTTATALQILPEQSSYDAKSFRLHLRD